MNIFKFDSPVMNFIGKVADMIILNILCLICSIPIITFGAAYTAKYYVSMKIVRGEEGTVFKPYFKAFASNFKQATIAWIIQLFIIAILIVDWIWIFNKGFLDVPLFYRIAIIVLSLLAVFVTMTIFPFFARYELTLREAFKGAILFSFLQFIKLFLIAAIEVITFIACLWYGQWLPVILLFGTTTAFYFLNLTMIKGFNKIEAGLEKKQAEEDEEEIDKENSEEGEAEKADTVKETQNAVSSSDENEEILILRPDEHTLKGKINAEKETVKALTFSEKLTFFKDYYLGKTILIAIVAIFVLWFLYDAFLGKKETVYSGGLLYCDVTAEGKVILTEDLLKVMVPVTMKQKKQVMLSDDLSLDFVENEHEITADASQDQMLAPMIMAGYYDYFLIDAKLIDHYELLDCYKDLSGYVTKFDIPTSDVYYSYSEKELEEIQQIGLNPDELSDDKYINAIRLPEERCEELGIYSRSGEGVYAVLLVSGKNSERDDLFMSVLLGKSE